MNINNHYSFYEIYTGAYNAKSPRPTVNHSEELHLSEIQKKSIRDALNAAAVEYRLFGEDYDYASISEAGHGFTVSDEVRDMGEMTDLSERVKTEADKRDQKLQMEHVGEIDEILWGCSQNQWLIFSEYLYNGGFFDDMSADEARKIDELLQSITSAMDTYSGIRQGWSTGYDYCHDKPTSHRDNCADYLSISSYGMHFMLESCTAALQYFSENYIEDGVLREKFQNLIDIFHTHNEQKITGHQSREEIMDGFRSKYLAYIEAAMKLGAQMAGESFQDSAELGGVTHTESEENDYLSQLSLMFRQLKDGNMDFDKIWRKIEDAFTDYASGGSHRQSVRSLALDRAGDSLNQMRQMWAELTGSERRETSLDVKA